MVLGRKAKRIVSLEERVAECDRHAPFIPMAQEIGSRITAVVAEQSKDLDALVEAALAEVEASERTRLLAETFKELPPETRLATLLKYYNDDETREALAAERQRLVAKDETEKAIMAQQAECRDNHRINLFSVPKGIKVLFELYDLDDLADERRPQALRKHYYPDRSLSVASLSDGKFQVLEDIIEGEGQNMPEFKAHEVIKLGGALNLDEETGFNVYYGAELNCIRTSKGKGKQEMTPLHTTELDLGIGFISMNNVEVMGPSTLPETV